MKKIISFVGAPGCGKGYLIKKFIEVVSQKNNIPLDNIAVISMGELIRREIKNQTKLGLKIQQSKKEGCLAPDSIIIPMLHKAFNKTKASLIILDGYPRTQEQFESLHTLGQQYNLNMIYRNIPEELIKKRIENRRICSDCGTEHTANEGTCSCGGKLIRRKEDIVWEDRMAEYKEVTLPMIENAKNRTNFFEISYPNIESYNLCDLVSKILKEKNTLTSNTSVSLICNALKENHIKT